MAEFRYTARDAQGRASTGIKTAATVDALVDDLKRSGLMVIRISEQAEKRSSFVMPFASRVSEDHLLLFFIELAKMVEVGIPLLTALRTMADQNDAASLRRVILDVASSVESGSGLSEAMAKHPEVFDTVYVSLVRAGEASGKLDDVLRRLAEFSKQRSSIRQQLITALVYPCFLLVVGVSIIGFLVMAVIPKFMALFLEAEVPLPLPTRLLYDLSQMLLHYWILIGGGIVGVGILFELWRRSPMGRLTLDTWSLRLPVIGPLVRQIILSRICRTFETLLSSGVPILDTLEIVEDVCGNQVLSRTIREVRDSVRGGASMSEPLRRSPHIPPMMGQLVVVGEASGTVDQMLRHLADFYDERVQHGIKRATAFVEPLFLMVMGSAVAFIMASLLLPLFRLASVVRA